MDIIQLNLCNSISRKHVQDLISPFKGGRSRLQGVPELSEHCILTSYWKGNAILTFVFVHQHSQLTKRCSDALGSAIIFYKNHQNIDIKVSIRLKDMSRFRVKSRCLLFESELSQLDAVWVEVESLIFLKKKLKDLTFICSIMGK